MKCRECELLAMLLSKQRVYSNDELCMYFDVSNRLMRYTIDKANDLLEEYNIGSITKVHGKGIFLDLSKHEVEKVHQVILGASKQNVYATKEDREIMILFSILDDSKPSFAYDYQQSFGVSKSSIDFDMRNIRNECKVFHLKITSTPKKGFRLCGDEWAIRLMLNNLINTKFDLLRLMQSSQPVYLETKEKVVLQYLNEKDVRSIFEMLRKSVGHEEILDNELYCAQLAIYFAFWKQRYVQGNRIQEEDRFIKKYQRRHCEKIVDGFLDHFELNHVEQVELNYLDFMVDSLNLQRNQAFSKDWVKGQLLSIQLINQMEELRAIPYQEEPTLFENLVQHMGPLLKRLENGIQIYNPLKHMIEVEYESIFMDVRKSCVKLKSEFTNLLSDEEVAYLSIHFSAAEEKIKQRSKAKYRVIVVCGHGLATGELLANKLKQHYCFDVIGIISSYEVHAIARLNAHFVLKTTDSPIEYLPSLQINPMLAQEDYDKIQRFINMHPEFSAQVDANETICDLVEELVALAKKNSHYLKEKEFESNVRMLLKNNNIAIVEKGMQPMISELLKDEYIQLNIKAKDWEDAINKAAQPLVEHNKIEVKYIQAMIESVHQYGPYIVIGEGIALAHARPTDGVNALGISVMTLDPPINFGQEGLDPVSLIFCLAAIDNHAHLKLMSTIVRLINEDGKVAEVSRQKDKDGFKEILFGLEIK